MHKSQIIHPRNKHHLRRSLQLQVPLKRTVVYSEQRTAAGLMVEEAGTVFKRAVIGWNGDLALYTVWKELVSRVCIQAGNGYVIGQVVDGRAH
ncbi:hypothetical protein GN958_ATG06628 [Phytophthora infestans]|uniref:Uncharacterized protein n=1 Tax=Phytophthora infestans TaxID=4787 RepID=A0A8S9UYE0_PHYIN|nr:hypothetical protein GN958_ATG06628 [Phytophthora infestans]